MKHRNYLASLSVAASSVLCAISSSVHASSGHGTVTVLYKFPYTYSPDGNLKPDGNGGVFVPADSGGMQKVLDINVNKNGKWDVVNAVSVHPDDGYDYALIDTDGAGGLYMDSCQAVIGGTNESDHIVLGKKGKVTLSVIEQFPNETSDSRYPECGWSSVVGVSPTIVVSSQDFDDSQLDGHAIIEEDTQDGKGWDINQFYKEDGSAFPYCPYAFSASSFLCVYPLQGPDGIGSIFSLTIDGTNTPVYSLPSDYSLGDDIAHLISTGPNHWAFSTTNPSFGGGGFTVGLTKNDKGYSGKLINTNSGSYTALSISPDDQDLWEVQINDDYAGPTTAELLTASGGHFKKQAIVKIPQKDNEQDAVANADGSSLVLGRDERGDFILQKIAAN